MASEFVLSYNKHRVELELYTNYDARKKLRKQVSTSIRLHLLVGGSTGPDFPYSILTVAKKFELEPAAYIFVWEKCCHLTLCLFLMEPNFC